MKLITFITLLLLGTSAWAVGTQKIAGYAGETTGGVAFAFNKLGQKRKLVDQAPVFEGETLITSKTAKSSVIFTDGTLIQLNPSTQFRVEKFRFGAQEEEPSAVFRMLKGGFRFISGLVNKQRGGNLTFRTATATIGVRGSAGSFSEDGTIEVYEGTFDVAPASGGKGTTLVQGQTAKTEGGVVKKTKKLTKAQIQSEMKRLINLQVLFKGLRGLAPGAPTPDLDKVEKAIAEKIKQGEALLKLPVPKQGGGSGTAVKTASGAKEPTGATCMAGYILSSSGACLPR